LTSCKNGLTLLSVKSRRDRWILRRLPLVYRENRRRVGAHNWGFVAGKTQTIYPRDSWGQEYTAEPPVWFHDNFRPNGKLHVADEVDFIRGITGTVQRSR